MSFVRGLAALSVLPFLSSGGGGFVAALLAGVLAIALSLSGVGYLCGLWARYSLKAPFFLSPTAALGRITRLGDGRDPARSLGARL
jgi:hypothetical protein